MNTPIKGILPITAMALLLAGCAGTSTDSGIGDLSATISRRTGHTVGNWESARGAGEVSNPVRELLRQPLTADSAARIALLNNPTFQARLQDIGIAQADVIEAGLLENPTLFGSAKFPDREPRAPSLEASLGQNFLDLLMLPLRKRMARAELEKTKLEVAQDAVDLVSEVKQAVYTLQAREQLRERMRLIQKSGAAGLEFAQELREAGNITELELANQQASYDEARLELAELELEIVSARESINRLLGLYGSDLDWRVKPSLPDLPGSDPAGFTLEQLALTQRYDLLAVRLELASLARALKLTRTYRFLGTMEVGVSVEREPDGANLAGPELSVELPIFHQGQGRIAKQTAQFRKAERLFEAMAIEIRSEVREAQAEMRAKRERAKFYHDSALPTRLAIVNQTQLQYNAMQTGALELLTAKEAELRAEREYIQALEDYWKARARLEGIVGGSLTGDKSLAKK